MLKDFKDFVMRGNVLDLAVAVIIGAAFGNILSLLMSDILMPPWGSSWETWISAISLSTCQALPPNRLPRPSFSVSASFC